MTPTDKLNWNVRPESKRGASRSEIVGNPKTNTPLIIPVSKSTWWAGVKAGRFPQPIKLGPNTTVWRVEDIRALIDQATER